MSLPAIPATTSRRSILELAAGLGMIVSGAVILLTASTGGQVVLGGAPIFTGLVAVLHSMAGLTGYKAFVAWRYLLVHEQKVTTTTKVLIGIALAARGVLYLCGVPLQAADLRDPMQLGAVASMAFLMVVVFWGVLRFSKPSMIIFLLGVGIIVAALVGTRLVAHNQVPLVKLSPELQRPLLQVLNIVWIGGAIIAGLATFFGSLRAFFTFFTTVPIGGVWIGTAALVCVLSVMSGFENDLRDKILGSNAHIQITREDGDFVDWRDAKAKIDRIPGVVASTPFAVSEVVIASNSNATSVIIKGIDPETVGKVTDLISDLEDPDAMKRLLPISKEVHDRTVPQVPRPKDQDIIDPPPDDMPNGGDPIDFSGPGAGPGDDPVPPAGTPRSASASRAAPDDEPYGGDAAKLISASDPAAPPEKSGAGSGSAAAAAVIDPPPPDMLTSDAAPIDYSQPDTLSDLPTEVADIPLEPTLSRRTRALPGILVGKELVKQTHLYPGEEVRVVSPLSDPSNPDATGTPIPFNRDYRVAGVFFTGMYEYDFKYVYVTLDSLQDFLDRGDAVDGIEVRIEDADDTGRYVPTETSAGLIRETLGPGYRIVDWRELNRSLFSALKLEKIAMFLVLGIVILVASFSIVGNLIMVVIEKAREIALLKTLGASDVGVMQLFAIQGLLIGLVGTLLGVTTGLAGCWAGKRFGLPLNPDVYYIDRLPIHVDWQSVAAAAAAGVLISIAATLYPALLAARVRPSSGLRQ